MAQLRILVRQTTSARFNADHPRIMQSSGEYVLTRPTVQPVESLMTGDGGQLMARTTGGDVWPCGHADHRDYDLVAL